MRRPIVLLAVLAACGAASGSPSAAPPAGAEPATPEAPFAEQPIPADLRDPGERSIAVGQRLHVLDEVAAIGTDVLLTNVSDVQNAGVVGAADEPRLAAGTRLRGQLVYLLAGRKQPNVAVLGRHFRALVPLGGTRVSSMQPLSGGSIEIPTRGPDGKPGEGLIVSHVIGDFPLETDVFASLRIRPPSMSSRDAEPGESKVNGCPSWARKAWASRVDPAPLATVSAAPENAFRVASPLLFGAFVKSASERAEVRAAPAIVVARPRGLH